MYVTECSGTIRVNGVKPKTNEGYRPACIAAVKSLASQVNNRTDYRKLLEKLLVVIHPTDISTVITNDGLELSSEWFL